MHTPFDRRTAVKFVAGACLSVINAGFVTAQPRPTPPAPGGVPNAPAGPGMPAPKDIAVPNSPDYPREIAGRTLEMWIKDINSDDPAVREQAIRVVLMFGPSARNAIAAITLQVKRLNDISPQATALIALAELVPMLPPTPPGGIPDARITNAVNAIIGVMDSPEAVIRFRAATALGWIGPPARGAVRSLTAHVVDRQSWEIRKAVCFALGRCGRDDNGFALAGALEALSSGVADRESKAVRLEALQSVLVLGPPNPPTPLHLMDVLKQRAAGAEKDKNLLIWVRVAIMALDPAQINDKNVAVVAKEMKNADADVRLTAIKAVGVMGPRAKEFVQDLIDMLPKATEPVVMVELCGALARMGQYAERAIPSLETLQTKDNPTVKEAAKIAVDAIRKAIDQAKQQPVMPKK